MGGEAKDSELSDFIGFHVSPRVRQAIADAAWRERITLSEFLRRLCDEYLAKNDDEKGEC